MSVNVRDMCEFVICDVFGRYMGNVRVCAMCGDGGACFRGTCR